jgi:hypothetical protein
MMLCQQCHRLAQLCNLEMHSSLKPKEERDRGAARSRVFIAGTGCCHQALAQTSRSTQLSLRGILKTASASACSFRADLDLIHRDF